jgi:drug/metabolite transporter (DMT)-like permease
MSRRGWLLFTVMSLIWGSPYLLIKVAVDEVAPVQLVFLRTVVPALVLAPVALAKGFLPVVRRHWRPILAFALLEMTGPWFLLPYAERELSSSVTGILIAATPAVGVVLGRLAGGEGRLRPIRIIGMVTGTLGVAVLLGVEFGRVSALALGAVCLVIVGYAAGPLVVSRRLGEVPDVAVTATALSVTALLYLPLAGPSLPHLATTVSGRVAAAVAGLALLCTLVAMLVFFALIREVGPSRALVITYVNPAVAVLLGVAVLDETFRLTTAIGFVLVLLGCVLATQGQEAAATP